MNTVRPFLLLVVFGLLTTSRHCHAQDAASSQKVTVDGAVIEAHDVTFGTVHMPTTSEGTFSVSGGSSNNLKLWVREPGKADLGAIISRIKELDIHLPDGQILLGTRGGSGGRNTKESIWELGSFSIVPWREKELDVRFVMDGKEHHLRFPNPAYRTDLPSWLPQPLPLKWEKDGLSVTLHSLDLIWNKDLIYKGLRWELRPKWSVKWNGQPADKWFSVSALVEDAGGNRSYNGGLLGEPAWKLQCSVSPSYGFPFAKEDVRWFEAVDPERAKTIQTGECDMLAIDPESRSFGILFAGLFAPGEYELEDGKVVAQSPPGKKGGARMFQASLDAETGRIKISVTRTAFIRHVRQQLEPGWKEVWQTDDGEALYLGGAGFRLRGEEPETTTVWDHQHLWAAQGKPFRYGIARVGEPHRFEFIVRPPAIPAGGKEGSSGARR